MSHSYYLQHIFEGQDFIVNHFMSVMPQEILNDDKVVYVGTGISGVAALAMLKQAKLIDLMAIIRKPNEACHSYWKVESNCLHLGRAKWVFVDDIICSGATIRTCASTHGKAERLLPENCLGAFLYNSNEGFEWNRWPKTRVQSSWTIAGRLSTIEEDQY